MLLTICVIIIAVLGSVNAACDSQGLSACITDNNQLQSLIGTWTPILDSRSEDKITRDLLERSCGIFQAFVDCAKTKAIDTCDSTVAAIMTNTPKYCNQEWRCKAYVNTCSQTEPSLVTAYNNRDVRGVTNGSLCPAIVRFSSCMTTSSTQPTCAGFDPSTADIVHLTDYFLRLCRENECSTLTTCKTIFNIGSPSLEPFNSQTCTLWENFVTCSGGALSSCSGISPAAGTPTAAAIAGLVKETCMWISLINLYAKQDFQSCVKASLTIKSSLTPKDVLSPYFFCSTLQAALSCAEASAQSCDQKEVFNDRIMKAASLGCAGPRPNVSCCADLAKCGSPLNAVMSTSFTFNQICSAIQTYLSCGDSAVRSCNSTIVVAARNAVPRLDTLSGIAGRICSAMNGQAPASCQKYLTCVQGYLSYYGVTAMPSTDGERVFGRNWCPIMTRTLECALFYEDQCPMSASLKTSLQDTYSDLIASGCSDEYTYLTRAPRSGAKSLDAVPVWAVITLSFVADRRLL